MENWDILIGVLLVIVFVLLVQRVASPFHCQEGETEKDGNCVSNSYKDRWWAFWEDAKCKRGELQSDYTCLASMIWDAVSPGQAPPPAPAPTGPDQRAAAINAFNNLVGTISRNMLITGGASTELTVSIAHPGENQCPFPAGSKIRTTVSGLKAGVDDQGVTEIRMSLSNVFRILKPDASDAFPVLNLAQQISAADLILLGNQSVNFQTGQIMLNECPSDIPVPTDPTGAVPVVIAYNLLTTIAHKASEQSANNNCTKASVMTLDSDGKPNGILTGPGQTITRGTADTYVPGKVRLYGPIAIDGVGKQAGTSFHTQLLETPCGGTDVTIGDWARFDVKKPDSMQETAANGPVQTAVASSCRAAGEWAERRADCCSGRYSIAGLIDGMGGPCAP